MGSLLNAFLNEEGILPEVEGLALNQLEEQRVKIMIKLYYYIWNNDGERRLVHPPLTGVPEQRQSALDQTEFRVVTGRECQWIPISELIPLGELTVDEAERLFEEYLSAQKVVDPRLPPLREIKTFEDLVPENPAADLEDRIYTVYYQLTVAATVPNWSDTEEAVGRWFRSRVYIGPNARLKDYSYPYALQEDGGWMMTGRVVRSFANVILFQEIHFE